MRKTRRLVKELASYYLAEIQKRLPGVVAMVDPKETFDAFDGVIRISGPYNHWEDEAVSARLYDLAWEIYEQHGVHFFVQYEQQDELAGSPAWGQGERG